MKLANKCPFIANLSKKFMYVYLNMMANLESRPDKSAFDKIFLSKNLVYTAMGAFENNA